MNPASVLEQIAALNRDGSPEARERARRLKSTLRLVLVAADMGAPIEAFTPAALAETLPTEEELAAIFGEEATEQTILDAATAYSRAMLEAAENEFSIPMDLYHLQEDGTLLAVDPKREAQSRARACLASVLEIMGMDLAFYSVRIYLPPQGVGIRRRSVCEEYGIPIPPVPITDDAALSTWQRTAVFERLTRHCEKHGVIPVKTSPERRGPESLSFVDVTVTDQATFARLLPEGSNLSHWVYLKLLFTPAAIHAGAPALEDVRHIIVTKEQQDRLAELLGYGAYKGDGWGFVVPRVWRDRDLHRLAQRTIGRRLAPAELATWRDVADYLATVDGQFRWAELERPVPPTRVAELILETLADAEALGGPVDPALFTDELAERIAEDGAGDLFDAKADLRIRALAKGTLVPLDRNELARWMHADVYHPIAASDDTVREAYFTEVASLIEDILAHPEVTTVLLVEKDQVKVGTPSPVGRSILLRTYLTGADPNAPIAPYKPSSHTINGSSQQIMLLSRSAFGDLLRHMTLILDRVVDMHYDPAGIARAINPHLADLRVLLETGDEETTISRDTDEILSQAVLSSLITAVSKPRAIRMATGLEPKAPGNLAMPRAIAVKAQAQTAKTVARLMLNFGAEFLGYLNHTCSDTIDDFVRANHLNRTRILDAEGSFAAMIPPTASDGVCWTPQSVAKPLNMDDDGDFAMGMAAVMPVSQHAFRVGRRTIRTERLMKVVLQSRYPQVDAPILWAVPVGVPTPWDGRVYTRPLETGTLTASEGVISFTRDEELYYDQEADFRSYMTAFAPAVDPDLDPTRLTQVVHCSSTRLSRLGATKSGLAPTTITGALTLQGTLEMVQRHVSLNRTGMLTRNLERFLVLKELTQHEIARQQAESKGLHDPFLDTMLEEYTERARRTAEDIEAQVTAIKKDVKIRAPQSLLVPLPGSDRDYWMNQTEEDVRNYTIPGGGLAYHALLHRVTSVQKDYAGPRGLALETLVQQGFIGRGKEIELLRAVLRGFIKGGVCRAGGSVDRLVKACRAISMDLKPWIAELKHHLERVEITPELEKEAAVLREQIRWWNELWKEHAQQREAALKAGRFHPDLLDDWERRSTDLSKRTKLEMRRVGASASLHALRYAILGDWQTRAERADGQVRSAASVIATIALCGTRLPEVFSLGLGQVQIHTTEFALEVFSPGVDLPGETNRTVDGVVKYLADRDQFALSANGQHYALVIRDRDGDAVRPENGMPLRLLLTSKRGGFVCFRRRPTRPVRPVRRRRRTPPSSGATRA